VSAVVIGVLAGVLTAWWSSWALIWRRGWDVAPVLAIVVPQAAVVAWIVTVQILAFTL
jgi:hypothetical protein